MKNLSKDQQQIIDSLTETFSAINKQQGGGLINGLIQQKTEDILKERERKAEKDAKQKLLVSIIERDINYLNDELGAHGFEVSKNGLIKNGVKITHDSYCGVVLSFSYSLESDGKVEYFTRGEYNECWRRNSLEEFTSCGIFRKAIMKYLEVEI